MMPKGVEHRTAVKSVMLVPRVRIPMMPKGVEHAYECEHGIIDICENSDDAERR